jgi:protein-tyrosine phosphatase
VSSRDDVFEVVFVCTGNRARSALAEAMFRRLVTGLPAAVSSAGTLDVGPMPALTDAVDAGRRLGLDLTAHTARALRRVDLSPADLVLGFEPAHVATAVVDGGADPARSFLLGELVMLLEEVSPANASLSRARAAVAAADSRRVRYRPDRAAPVVRDPLGKSPKFMYRTAKEIDGLVGQLVLRLFGDLQNG